LNFIRILIIIVYNSSKNHQVDQFIEFEPLTTSFHYFINQQRFNSFWNFVECSSYHFTTMIFIYLLPLKFDHITVIFTDLIKMIPVIILIGSPN